MRVFLVLFITSFFGLAKAVRIDSIAIEGNKKSKESYLRKLILTQKDIPYDSLTVHEDIIRLIREPAISHAYFEV